MTPLAERVLARDRRALAQAITLVESTRPEDEAEARTLLTALLPRTGGAARVGISGAPGVGKSTLIEAFGLHLTGLGHKLAVLAVDPSSRRSGGSILGDKTRMAELARHPDAFIRPSPAAGSLGGVARRTREAMLVCEAAGFDVVLIETVGVGQSEVAVADLVDSFVLLLGPGGGDDLQGIKRGIMELADIVAVTKGDGTLLTAARHVAADVSAALRIVRPAVEGWQPPVIVTSAIEGKGMAELWRAIGDHRRALGAAGIASRRAAQAKDWFRSELAGLLLAELQAHPDTAALIARLEDEVASGRLAPAEAARQALAAHPGARST